MAFMHSWIIYYKKIKYYIKIIKLDFFKIIYCFLIYRNKKYILKEERIFNK